MKRFVSAVLALALLGTVVFGPALGLAQAGKSMVVGLGQEPDRLYQPARFAGVLVANLVFDSLVAVDDRMQPYPALATAVPSFENGLAVYVGEGADRQLLVTFPLRRGVTFSDGAPFTADDVVYQYGLMMNPESGFQTALEEKYASVEKVDDFTVRFTFLSANQARALDPERYADQGDEPVVDPRFLFGLHAGDGLIYSSRQLRAIVGDDPRSSARVRSLVESDFARSAVGTGPFALQAWEPGVSLTFASRGVALPQRLGRPNVDVLTFQVFGSKDDLVDALLAGHVQLVTQDALDAADAPVIDALMGVRTYYTQGTTWEHLDFNLDRPILAQPAVRKAIAYGIDRQALVEAVFGGRAEVAHSPVPPWSWAYDVNLPHYEYNPAHAAELLDAAEWRPGPDGIRVDPAGRRLSLRYWSTPAGARPRVLPLIAEQLRVIGVEMRVEFVPASVFFDPRPSSPQALVARQFDVAQFGWAGSFDPGADLRYTGHSDSIPRRGNAYRGGNVAGYRNGRSDVLLDQGLRYVDQSFRQVIYNEAQELWMEDLPVLPLYWRPAVTAASERLVNLRPTMASRGETWNAEQWDLLPG